VTAGTEMLAVIPVCREWRSTRFSSMYCS